MRADRSGRCGLFRKIIPSNLHDKEYNLPTTVASHVDLYSSEASPRALPITATAFVVLFCIVGLALWGLPSYYDLVEQFGGTRAQVGSGNVLGNLVVGPAITRLRQCTRSRSCLAFYVIIPLGRRSDVSGSHSRGMALLGAAAIALLPKRSASA